MVSYISYVRKDADSDYGVEFPDVSGCLTAGRTLDEARAMAAEALPGHLAVLEEKSQPVSAPSTMEALKDDPDQAGALLILVDLPADFLKAERVNVMIPAPSVGPDRRRQRRKPLVLHRGSGRT